MSIVALPALLGLLTWWASTGLILFLDGLPRRTFPISMAGATGLLGIALYGLGVSAADASAGGACLAFACGLGVWGWLEISFYLGYVTGPRQRHCHPGCSGWRHFGHAIQASLYHELAILVLAALIVALTSGAPNQFGLWTFCTLWWMHQSARLNVFLGVSNLNAEFLPEHLSHLRGFFRSAPMNLLFPVSATVSTTAAVLLAQRTLAAAGDAFLCTGYALVTTMMALAILEHWFLVLPPGAAGAWNRLWRWSLRSRAVNRKHVRLQTQAAIGGRP